jgi:hypothetical protein
MLKTEVRLPFRERLADTTTTTAAEAHRTTELRVAELQRMVDRTKQLYGVWGAAPIVRIESLPSGVAAEYRPYRGYWGIVIAVSPTTVARPEAAVIMAHELGHYLLNHHGRLASDEMDANAKGVEVLTRLGMSPDQALSAMYDFLARQPRNTVRSAPGHDSICAEIEDLLRRYPDHPTQLTTCPTVDGKR